MPRSYRLSAIGGEHESPQGPIPESAPVRPHREPGDEPRNGKTPRVAAPAVKQRAKEFDLGGVWLLTPDSNSRPSG